MGKHVITECDVKYDVGVIGGGYVSLSYHCPIIETLPTTQLKWVADTNFDQAKKVTSIFSGRPIKITSVSQLPSCDIVVLATPVTYRAEYIREFGARGTPIFSEKPFALSTDEHKKYIDIADTIAVNYMRTNYNHVQQLHTLFKSDIINLPDIVEIQRGEIGGSTGGNTGMYRTHPEAGGILLERGCHTLSQLVYIFDDYDFEIIESEIIELDNIDVEFEIDIVAKSSGRMFDINYKQSLLSNLERKFRLQYDSGDVKFDHLSGNEIKLRVDQNEESIFIKNSDDWASDISKCHLISWLNFIKYVENGSHVLGNDPTLPEVTRLIDSIRKNASITEVVKS